MSERLTIDVVCEEDIWGNSYGEYQAYMLDVRTEDGRIVGNVKSNRKLKDDGSHNEPREGEEVWGTLESQKGGSYKLTLDTQRMKNEPLSGHREASTGTSGGSQNVSKGQSKGDVDWDARNAEIRRQHSQEMALRIYAVHLQANPDLTAKVDLPQIATWADWFDQDAIEAGQKANQGQLPSPSSVGESRTAVPDSPPADDRDLQEYGELLDNAGLTFPGARDKVSEFMAVVLPEDRLKKALTGLQDLDRQGSVLAQLKQETEKWVGGPLPQGDALDGDDSVPF